MDCSMDTTLLKFFSQNKHQYNGNPNNILAKNVKGKYFAIYISDLSSLQNLSQSRLNNRRLIC